MCKLPIKYLQSFAAVYPHIKALNNSTLAFLGRENESYSGNQRCLYFGFTWKRLKVTLVITWWMAFKWDICWENSDVFTSPHVYALWGTCLRSKWELKARNHSGVLYFGRQRTESEYPCHKISRKCTCRFRVSAVQTSICQSRPLYSWDTTVKGGLGPGQYYHLNTSNITHQRPAPAKVKALSTENSVVAFQPPTLHWACVSVSMEHGAGGKVLKKQQ